MEVLTFYSDNLMVLCNSTNLCVFNFTILLISRKFDARGIYASLHVLQYAEMSMGGVGSRSL